MKRLDKTKRNKMYETLIVKLIWKRQIGMTKQIGVMKIIAVKIIPCCFHFGCTDSAADDLRRKKVLSLVNTIVKNGMSLQQEEALVLQRAVLHPLVRPIVKSAGIVDNNDFMIKNYVLKNTKRAVKQDLKTNAKKGQANDDLRSFVQSVVIPTMPSTEQQVEDKRNGVFVPAYIQIADTIGVPKSSYRGIRKTNQSKRDLLQLRG